MDKLRVHDIECEKTVIGVLVSYANAYDESADILNTDVFWKPEHQELYKAIKNLHDAGETVDLVTLFAYIQQHPNKDVPVEAYYIAECVSSVITDIGFREHCLRLHELWERRQLWLIGQKLISAGETELADIDTIKQETVEAIHTLDDTPQASIVGISDALKELNGIVEANLSGERKNGIPTGFRYLDERGGLQRSDLIVIAAEFSQGKTSLALDFTICAAKNGYPVAFYSTEMMGTQLAARMLASDSGISSRTILQEVMTTEQLAVYDKAVGHIERLPIYFDDTSTLSVERIVSSIRMMARKKKIAVACVDYLQVLQTNEKSMSRTEEQFFGLAARKFKNLAKELNIAIVLMSQIARSKETSEPTLSRVRGSGQISEAADVVLLIYRPEQYNMKYSGEYSNVNPQGTALVKLAKGRNIGTGDFICGYHAPTTHFYELASIPRISENGVANPHNTNEDRPF